MSGESPDRDMIANIQAQILEMKKEILDGNLSSVLTRFADLILVSLVAVMIGLMIVPNAVLGRVLLELAEGAHE